MSTASVQAALDLGVAALLATAAGTVLHRAARSPERGPSRALSAAAWGALAALLARLAAGTAGDGELARSALSALLTAAAAVAVLVTARGLRTPGEGAWFGLSVGLGRAIVGTALGEGTSAALLVAAGAAATAFAAWAIVEPRPPRRAGWLLAAVVAAAVVEHAGEALGAALDGSAWAPWAVAGVATVLVLAGTRAVERRLLHDQLGREAGLGTLAVELVPALVRLPSADGWASGLRRDEREALLRTVIRLAVTGWAQGHAPPDRVPVVGLEVGRLRSRLRHAMTRPEADDETGGD